MKKRFIAGLILNILFPVLMKQGIFSSSVIPAANNEVKTIIQIPNNVLTIQPSGLASSKNEVPHQFVITTTNQIPSDIHTIAPPVLPDEMLHPKDDIRKEEGKEPK